MSIFLGSIKKTTTKEELELKRLKLYGKAFKMFPNSKEQLKTRAEIDKITKLLNNYD